MKNAYSQKNEVKAAYLRQKQLSSLIRVRFPDVAGIVIKIEYTNQGAISLKRTLNYYPENHAFFKINCLSDGCENGGLNMTRVITSMVKSHSMCARGNLRCTNRDPAVSHADMSYDVSIKYD